MYVKSETLKKGKPKQKFVRLNIDERLESVLQEYENRYSLLSRSDIVRMLLSEAIETNKLRLDPKDKKDLASVIGRVKKGKIIKFDNETEMENYFSSL